MLYKHKLNEFLTKLNNKVKGDWVLDEIKLNAQILIKTDCKNEIDEIEWWETS